MNSATFIGFVGGGLILLQGVTNFGQELELKQQISKLETEKAQLVLQMQSFREGVLSVGK